ASVPRGTNIAPATPPSIPITARPSPHNLASLHTTTNLLTFQHRSTPMATEILSSYQGLRCIPPTLDSPQEGDTLWRQQSEMVVRSLRAFLLAESTNLPNLHNRAGEVYVFHDGCFKTIRELFDQHCTSHTSHSQIYEVWALETARRVQALMPSL